MKRSTVSKRVIACVIALALVFSCVLTVFADSLSPFTGDESQGTCDVRFGSPGGRVKYEVGPRAGSTRSLMTIPVAVGSACRLEATDTTGLVFLFWQDAYANRVYSYDPVLEFTASTNMSLVAYYQPLDEEERFVAFVNYGGTIFEDESDYFAPGDTVTMPTDVKLPGFTFTGWSKSVSDIAADNGNQVVYPLYTVNDESYTVTLTDDTYASGAGTYSNFQTVSVKAREKNGSGESFSYWQDADGTIVSYERNYSFRINYDVTLTAVFGEDVTPEPVIRISKIHRDTQDMKLTFYAERSVPEGYTVLSHGMLMATGKNVVDAQMKVGSANASGTSTVRKVIGTSNEACGTFSLAKTDVSYTTIVVARPFVICRNTNGDQFIVYGDVVRTTNGATD